jgi:hypothetical protein
MDPATIAVVTMTWARTRDEEDVLLQSLRIAASLGLPMAIADRNGRREFVEQLAQLPRTVVVAAREEGLVPQIKAAFDRVADFAPDAILYTEPDKAQFFAGAATRVLERGLQLGEPAVVLAARSNASFLTFPAMQQYTESVANHLAGELVGERGDYSYGPFLMPRLLLPYVHPLSAHLGWGWRFAMFRAARRERLPVLHAIDDLPCPVEQRHEDDVDCAHRIRQLSENLLGLIG